MAELHLLPQLTPELLQFHQAPLDSTGARGLILQKAVAALHDVIDARLMTLDLLLQSLKEKKTNWFLITDYQPDQVITAELSPGSF